MLLLDGRFSPVAIDLTSLTPLPGAKSVNTLGRFTDYTFSSSMIVPVDTFNFGFRMPDDKGTTLQKIAQDGDIATLYANEQYVCTGIIDSVALSVDSHNGEKCSISGRNMLSQLEDNEAVSISADPLFGNSLTINQVLAKLLKDTRIAQNFATQDGPTTPNLFSTAMGETRLQALLRYLEPLNCLVWMKPTGQLCVGKPNFSGTVLGTLYCNRYATPVGSNILSLSMNRGSTTIPNTVTAYWSGAELAAASPQATYSNTASGPARLRNAGQNIIRSMVISTPDQSSTQGLTNVNRLAGGQQSYLLSFMKRMVAEANRNELEVSIVVAGHYNPNGDPFLIDQVYHITCDRADIDKPMYLYAVDYSLSPQEGQRTTLHFCNLGTIVADTLVSTSGDANGANTGTSAALGSGIA
jgi:prophage tail gpP-like protein